MAAKSAKLSTKPMRGANQFTSFELTTHPANHPKPLTVGTKVAVLVGPKHSQYHKLQPRYQGKYITGVILGIYTDGGIHVYLEGFTEWPHKSLALVVETRGDWNMCGYNFSDVTIVRKISQQ